jgi:hypothetical protein
MTKQSTVASARPRRTPLNIRNRLTVRNQESGYRYRVVNDVEDRVAQLQEQGYEIVPQDKVQVGDKRVDNASSLGSSSQISVGMGTKAVVMRQREDFWQEDQRAKQARVDETEQTMKGDARKAADYGRLQISVGKEE